MIPAEILNYVIIRKIGEGGMGQVFLARNKSIGQLVAIKMLHPRYGNNPLLRDKFRKEAIVLSSLNHPGIVKFLNYVENDNGVFLIMEYVEGMTLEDFINKKNGLIVEDRAYPMMKEILDAFSYAHGRGIIHRDIKPSNIFINSEGHIKVLDFGIAQIVSEVTTAAENQGGTPSYMSPEQVLNRDVDIRSDVYSLGVMFHQMLTGKAPYDTTSLTQVEIKHAVTSEDLRRMKDFYAYISDGMQNVIDTATRKNPDARYRNCIEFQKGIDKVLNPAKRNKWVIYGGIAAALAILTGVFFIWDYNRTKIKYYNDYAEVWEVPVGIGKLSLSDVKHRSGSYRMEYSKGKLRRMTYVNSAGKAIEHGETEYKNLRYPDTEYFYSDDGRVDFKKIYDDTGKLLFKVDYDENLKTQALKHDDEYGTPMRITANTTDLYAVGENYSNSRGAITHFLLTHDEDTGYLTKKLYAGNNNEPIGDSDNIFGMAYEHDDKGRITQITYLDAEGNPRNNKIGLGIKKFKYDEDDLWTEVAYYGIDGDPSHDGNNCFIVKLEYDKYGNRKFEKYYGSDGLPAMRADDRMFGMEYEYDDRGNRVRQMLIDGKGKPMTGRNGVSAYVTEFSEDGYPTMSSALDVSGKPVYAIEEGEPISTVKLKYDDKGRVVERRFFDKDMKNVNLTSGYSIVTIKFDSLGNEIRNSFFKADGTPALLENKYSIVDYEYDKLNRPVTHRFKNESGKLVKDGAGVCGYDLIYDKNGNLAEFKNVGLDGKSLIAANNGLAKIRYRYDDNGNRSSIEYLGIQGQPVLISGFVKIEDVYEPENNFHIESRKYGLSGLQEIDRFEYDKKGNLIKEYTVGANGKLVSGTCVTVCKYDKGGHVIETYAQDLYGNKIQFPGQKYASFKCKYDSHGNRTEIMFYSVNGSKSTDALGAHHRINRYDESNRLVYEKNLGIDGKPLKGMNVSAEGKVKYDERGNRTELICYDGYGKPAKSAMGVHKESYRYDDKNRVVSAEMTDEKGHLVDSRYGYAKRECKYDDNGNITSDKYYKATGKLNCDQRYTYNSKNNMTSLKIYNASGRLDDSVYGGWSQMIIVYKDDGVTPFKRDIKNSSGMVLMTQIYNKSANTWN